MIQLSKAQSVFLVADAFLITQVFIWLLGVGTPPILWLLFPQLPLFLVFFMSSTAMLLGVVFLCLLTNHTSLPFKFDRGAFLTLGGGIVAHYMLISLLKPFFRDGQPFDPLTWGLAGYLYLFSYIVCSPLAEEILVRGSYFEVLRRSWGDGPALNISTALFVIPHLIWRPTDYLYPPMFLELTLASVLFTYLYIVGGLVPAIAVHIFWNFYVKFLG